jgi:hypothetical protein
MANPPPSPAPSIPGFTYLGVGPACSGTGGGWSRSPSILYACIDCGGTMPGDHADYFDCPCGAVHLDWDAGRFGSRHGDNGIRVYRRVGASA